MQQKLFFEFSSQEILNTIEALTFYKDFIVPNPYKLMVEQQLRSIDQQLKLQNISLYVTRDNKDIHIGDKVIIEEDQEGIILGTSEDDNFYRVILIKENHLAIDEVPFTLIKKV